MRLAILFAALALSACASPSGPAYLLPAGAAIADTMAPPPVTIADKTTLDEQGALAAELAYRAANRAVEIAVDAGFIQGANAARVGLLDKQAYGALQTVRAAYRAGNASTYRKALDDARTAAANLLALTAK